MSRMVTGVFLWQVFITGAVAQTVINVPPDPAPHSVSGNKVLNLFEGGVLPASFDAESGATVNLNGGDAGFGFDAGAGSIVNVNAGNIRDFDAEAGSVVNITGGSLTNFFYSAAGSTMDISGGNLGGRFHAWGDITFHGDSFYIDNLPVVGLENVGDSVTLMLPLMSEFTGVLADGSPFAFSYLDDNDQLQNATLTLVREETPGIGAPEIILPDDAVPRGVRAGQTLVIGEGGLVGNDFHAAAQSAVVVAGGSIGENFEAAAANIDIRDGTVGRYFGVFSGSVVNVSGGTVSDRVRVLPGAVLKIHGGKVGSVYSLGESVVEIEGGTLTGAIVTRRETQLTVHGAEFRMNGEPILGLDEIGSRQTIDPPQNFVLTGTLSDGEPFAFSSHDFDRFEEGTLSLVRAETPPIDPGVISVPLSPAPTGIRAGQMLIVAEGGILEKSFNAGMGSAVSVEGGLVGDNLEAVGAVVTIRDGKVGDGFDAFDGTHVTLLGGEIGDRFYVGSGSEFHIDGGAVGLGFNADDKSNILITGGTIGDLVAMPGASVTISGGNIAPENPLGRGFQAYPGASVELIGKSFLMDGFPIPGLVNPGDSILLDNHNGEMLQVALVDGNITDFILRGSSRATPGNFFPGSRLQLTLAVPEPDGAANFATLLGLLFAIETLGRVHGPTAMARKAVTGRHPSTAA